MKSRPKFLFENLSGYYQTDLKGLFPYTSRDSEVIQSRSNWWSLVKENFFEI